MNFVLSLELLDFWTFVPNHLDQIGPKANGNEREKSLNAFLIYCIRFFMIYSHFIWNIIPFYVSSVRQNSRKTNIGNWCHFDWKMHETKIPNNTKNDTTISTRAAATTTTKNKKNFQWKLFLLFQSKQL